MFKSKGVREWTEMLLSLFVNYQEWSADYYLRSNSENGFSNLTLANPQPIRKRLTERQETEDYLIAIGHNIKRLCYLKYLNDDVSKQI